MGLCVWNIARVHARTDAWISPRARMSCRMSVYSWPLYRDIKLTVYESLDKLTGNRDETSTQIHQLGRIQRRSARARTPEQTRLCTPTSRRGSLRKFARSSFCRGSCSGVSASYAYAPSQRQSRIMCGIRGVAMWCQVHVHERRRGAGRPLVNPVPSSACTVRARTQLSAHAHRGFVFLHGVNMM